MKKCAVIVETRPISNLVEIIQEKHLKFIPLDWDLIMYLSKESQTVIGSETFGRNVDVRIIEDMNISKYNELLTSKDFWESLPYDKVLIFQSDSGLLRTGIDSFLEWDFIGAMWAWQDHGCNGGLSLRTPSVMLDVINSIPYVSAAKNGNEDVYFSNCLYQNGHKGFAPREVCQSFSVEAVFSMGSLGYHAIDKYFNAEVCSKILNQYNYIKKNETAI